MSGSITKTMLAAYFQDAEPTNFLSSMFRTTPRSFHSTEEVEIDIVRSEEDVSIVVQDLSAGYRANSKNLYTNKGFKPPIHKESIPVNAFDLIKRTPGRDPFQDVGFRVALVESMFDGMRNVEAKIRRSMEWQASQVLQTGKVTLTDAAGNTLYSLDYQPKTTHFPDAAATWAAGAGDPLADLTSLAGAIRNDGLRNPDQIIMGETAFENALKNTDFKARFDGRRADLGAIVPMQMGADGGNYRGTVELGNYKLDIWTYGGRYKDPQTGNSTQFIDPNKVVMRASTARLISTFGAIPNIGALLNGGTARLLPELPERFSSAANGMDMFANVWMTPDGEQMIGGVGARPLMIPVAIDTFGCLKTNP